MDRDCVTQFGLQAGMTYSSLAAAGRKKVQKFAELAYEAGVAAERERWKTARLLRHDYQGLCPDEQSGWDARDMDCPACRALAEFGP